jgi:lactoylglutathione lyase
MKALALPLLLLAAPLVAEDLPLLGLAHVAFRVDDLEKARAFYHGVLGYDEAFDLKGADGVISIAFFKVNENQYIEVYPSVPKGTTVMMSHIAFYCDDIEKVHKMVEERGLEAGKISTGKGGNRAFTIRKLPGQSLEYLEFMQYMPEGWQRQSAGKFLSDRRISTKFLHAGLMLTNYEAARHFYVDQLGFKQGLTPNAKPVPVPLRGHAAFRLPGGSGDFIELFNTQRPPEGRWIGVTAHLSLTVPDIDAAYRTVKDRGYIDEFFKPPHDGRWNDLYDPNGSRIELTGPDPRRK